MFDIDVRDILLRDGTPVADAWWAQLAENSQRGSAQVQTLARSVRETLDDDAADELGIRIAGLLDSPLDPPGRWGALFRAAGVFGGPRTMAAVGSALRRDLHGAHWKIEEGLRILRDARTREAAVQLRLCSRDAHEVAVLLGAHDAYRGFTDAMLGLLAMGDVDVPPEDLARYFALNLQDAMLHGTKFNARELWAAQRSSARQILSSVVWASYVGRRVDRTFRIDVESEGLLDAHCEAVGLDERTRIGVPHPAELAPEDRAAWGIALADFEIVTLFPQLDREFLPSKPQLPFGEIHVEVPHWELARFLFANGWTRHYESREWDFRTRASELNLVTHDVDGELRRIERFTFRSTLAAHATADHDIAYSESVAACLGVLEQFAPEKI